MEMAILGTARPDTWDVHKTKWGWNDFNIIPIGSMYGIYTNIGGTVY
jgi:hypothetical protein